MTKPSMVRIMTQDAQTKEKGSTTAYLVEGQNHLLQTRQFAWDGQRWFYAPDNRSSFRQVNPRDIPANVVEKMAALTGYTEEHLRQ